MTTKICDRCGTEIREYPWQAITFPTYSVVKVDTRMDGAVPVDLCRKCQNDFTEWLKKKPEAVYEIKSIPFEEWEKSKGERRYDKSGNT